MSRRSYSRSRIESLKKDKINYDPLINIAEEISSGIDIFNLKRGIEYVSDTSTGRKQTKISISYEYQSKPAPRKVFVRKEQKLEQTEPLRTTIIRQLLGKSAKGL